MRVRQEGPDDAGVARLVLNRPRRGNALDVELLSELAVAMKKLDDDPRVSVIVLCGSGSHFCTGIDLSVLHQEVLPGTSSPGSREVLRRRILGMQAGISCPESCTKPVLAMVHGACIGGGVDLIAACDLRYASLDATFSVREVDVGITADLGSLQRLPHILGYSKAVELAMTAANLTGQEAAKCGLVNAVFEDAQKLEEGVMKIANNLAAKPRLALLGTKAMLLRSRNVPVAQGLDMVATWNSAMIDAGEIIKQQEQMNKKKLSSKL